MIELSNISTVIMKNQSQNISLLNEAQRVIHMRWKWLARISHQDYKCQAEIINALFDEYKSNTDYKIIYHKVSILNTFASTSIFNISPIVRKILKLNIDNDLMQGKLDLVLKIATLSKTTRKNLSFATKYCALHNHNKYPIYDSLVRDYLARVISKGKLDGFTSDVSMSKWRDDRLRNYVTYVKAYKKFIDQYDLSQLNFWEVDQYIWTVCKCRKEGLNVVENLKVFKLINK